MASKRTKYLGINLTNMAKDLFNKNYKTLIKIIKEGKNKQNDILCLWIGRIYIFKIFV